MPFDLTTEYQPTGDQPRAIGELVAGLAARRPAPGAAGRHRLGQDLHHRQRGRQGEAADAGHRPQQDPGGPALRRVQGALPRERRRVLRQLLRLLPARGLRPLDRHVHREGLVDQRRDRPDAPLGDPLAAHPQRRDHRRLGLLHLRPGHRRGLLRPAAAAREGAGVRRATGSSARWSTSSTSATTSTSTAAPSACAATSSRSSRPTRRSGRSASSSSATRSSGSPSSTRCAAQALAELDKVAIFPGSHYVTAPETRDARHRRDPRGAARAAAGAHAPEQAARGAAARAAHPCSTWRCWSRWASARASRTTRAGSPAGRPGEPPPCLLDYFPKDFLLVIDESHQTVPQIGAMYRGDRSRKETLVEYGFRLPSALDNRPLKFDEFEALVHAGRLRLGHAGRVRAAEGAGRGGGADHPPHRPDRSGGRGPARSATRWTTCWARSASAAEAGERVLVTTLTKRMAEDLTEYYTDVGVRCATCTRTSTRSSGARSSATCARASSTCWSASTCCARGSTSPRCRWWPSSTPTRRASCARRSRSIQTIGRAARNVQRHG